MIIKNINNNYNYIKINNKIIEGKVINKEDNRNISYKEILDNYKKEYNNEQIKGRIHIENTDFEMIFAQSNDNSYYLDHLLNKEYNKLGSAFLDYRVNIDTSKKVNIYGHNNKVGTSFKYIMNYENQDFFNKYSNIIINTSNNDYKYKIFSIQIVDSNYIHMKTEFNTNEEFISYLNNIMSNSLYKIDIDLNSIYRVLTLQTCTNRKDGEFLLVNAYLEK